MNPEARKTFDLDARLIQFAAEIIDIAEALPKTYAGNHLSGQLIRSGTAPALQYGEAQSAESRSDFIHKMKVAVRNSGKRIIVCASSGQKAGLLKGFWSLHSKKTTN